METIVFAGGCFWCTHAVFARVRGVQAVQSGYANGAGPQPSYEQVCQGDTGYAEAVRVQFDPAQVALAALTKADTGNAHSSKPHTSRKPRFPRPLPKGRD